MLSIGTNDIKNAPGGVGKLETQALQLVNHVHRLFPDAKILIFSVLPMRIQHSYTARNFHILKYICRVTGSFYIDHVLKITFLLTRLILMKKL